MVIVRVSRNIRSDNNRCHTPTYGSLHIPPEKLQRGLRKGSTVILECDAWISLSFSSDIPFLLNFHFPILEPFTRLCLACCSLANTRCSDFNVRFESDALIGRRSGEIRGTFWTAATYRRTPKHFASIAVFATVSRPMKRNFFWLGAFLTIVFSMFANQPSPSTRRGKF